MDSVYFLQSTFNSIVSKCIYNISWSHANRSTMHFYHTYITGFEDPSRQRELTCNKTIDYKCYIFLVRHLLPPVSLYMYILKKYDSGWMLGVY